MPYIATVDNRYICEHSCGKYHYGNMVMVRDCCVQDAISLKEKRDRYAMTDQHPAAIAYLVAWNELTDAEMRIVDPEYCERAARMAAFDQEERGGLV